MRLKPLINLSGKARIIPEAPAPGKPRHDGPLPELTPHGPYRDYRMNRVQSPEEGKRWCCPAMPMRDRMMQMDPCEAMNQFAIKMKARPGLAFDDAVQSLTLRANRLNLKYVGNNTMWQDFRAMLADTGRLASRC